MNFNTSNQNSKIGVYSYFNISLDYTNQFRAQIGPPQPVKMENEHPLSNLSKSAPNQIYNSYNKQILLQKSISSPLTPQKENPDEISQYISDKKIIKNSALKIPETKIENHPQTPQLPNHIKRFAFSKSKFQHSFREKLSLVSQTKIYQNNDESEPRGQQANAQNKQEDKLPKRGLTYISKKLSEILRQKKRIKSSELFQISLFQDEEQHGYEQKHLLTGINGNQGQNEDINFEKQGFQLKDTKQRRNVRRRIYDSINVMVALGIIKKVKNEYFYVEQRDDYTEEHTLIQQEEILIKKKDYLRKLESDCQYKEKCLKYLTEAHSKMRILRKMNIEFEEKPNLTNENTLTNALYLDLFAGAEQKIEFPFVLFDNGSQDVQLINDSDQAQNRRKKVNDWTDCIEIENHLKQKQIDLIKISGENMRMISDIDCINLISSMEIQQYTDPFLTNQIQILRDYEIINQNKIKKNGQTFAKNLGQFNKE